MDVVFDPSLDHVYGDQRRIQHSISNLLSNAVKFTMDRGNISVKTWQDKENYFVSVKDDGIGIDQKEFEEIFEKFYTGSNVPKGKGTGLGLSLVKIFVEIHGGEVVVDSTLGVGTEMTCRLPKKLPISDEISHQDNIVRDAFGE